MKSSWSLRRTGVRRAEGFGGMVGRARAVAGGHCAGSGVSTQRDGDGEKRWVEPPGSDYTVKVTVYSNMSLCSHVYRQSTMQYFQFSPVCLPLYHGSLSISSVIRSSTSRNNSSPPNLWQETIWHLWNPQSLLTRCSVPTSTQLQLELARLSQHSRPRWFPLPQ